ncbi:hypothetical protein CCB80_06350 [Armatimonadetes bacterium Uphvl-Ar1]|nr:hypothetical protein CCB80_06350 [Armatimonadetes bacterium Uphvl-Ar1]
MFLMMGAVFVAQGRQEPERILGSFVTELDGRSEAQVHNARICAERLNGKLIAPGTEFSFNSLNGPWSRDRGYRRAPVSYGGQLIDAWGGGVCQTSTTIYNAALEAGFPVVERHAHHYAPNYISPGRDAAVAYPNIDLKWRNDLNVPVKLVVRAEGKYLRVELRAQSSVTKKVDIWQKPLAMIEPRTVRISGEPKTWVRNPGKAGHVVETWRSVNGVRQKLSTDSYPVMNRVLDGSSYR